MLIEQVLGNVSDVADLGRRDVDDVELRWWELGRRAIRKTSRQGRDVRVLLPLGPGLQDGDVLLDDGQTLLVIRSAPCEVLVIEPATLADAARVALVLGNLHAPTEVDAETVVTVADGPIEAALAELAIGYTRQIRRFRPMQCPGAPQVVVCQSLQVSRAAEFNGEK